jgi:hypothetical protein
LDKPGFFTAEIACLRLPVAFATQTGVDPHRQAEIAEPDAIGPSFIQAGENRSDSEDLSFLDLQGILVFSAASAGSAVRLKCLGSTARPSE